ncbi:MAG: PAS domain-containing protein [Myxococcales bacterium]|nr:PAS domain-containing protein [Myxococcales bacterium]
MGEQVSAESADLPQESAALGRRLAELEAAHAVLRASFEHCRLAQALICAREGRYLDVNAAFCELTGLARSAILGKTSGDLGLFANPALHPPGMVDGHSQGRAHDAILDLVRADGQRRRVLASARPLAIADRAVVSVTFEEQTDPEASHSAHFASEAQAVALLNALPDLLFEIDAGGRIYDYRGAREQLHVSPENFLGKTIDDVLPANACDVLHAGIREALQTGLHRGASYFLETAGQQSWFEVSMAPKDAERRRLIVLVRDITQRKQAQERLRAMLAAIPDLVIVLSRDGTYLELHTWNPAQLPASENRLLGRRLANHLPPEIAMRCLQQIAQTLETRTIQVVEYELLFAANDLRRLEVRTVPREADTVLALVRDISERMRAAKEKAALEEQLRHAHKMEAIGTLAGGIAHDFNNILGGLMGNLCLLDRLANNDAESGHIQEMKELVQRGADLAKQLLGFSRRGKYNVQKVDLVRVVQKAGTLFGRTRPDLTIRTQLGSDLHAVLMDHTQLEQVLLNLFVNAGQAMPDGGVLSLIAENVSLDEAQTSSLNLRAGPFVKLVVSDTGCGMDAATMARIFEPFFTTKAPGQGTGLGLASVYGIVRNHGGLIAVQSALGAGSSFTLYLPASLQPAEVRVPAPLLGPKGRGTLLLVDDEPAIRKVFSLLLAASGYTVLVAANGQEAIEQVMTHREVLSLVILDLTMPGLSGAKTFDALRELAPGLKVLLVSGHAEERSARELLTRGAAGFLQKPFDSATLEQKILALL